MEDMQIRLLMESSRDIIARFDRNYRYLYANKAVSRYFPQRPEDFIGKTHRELGFPEDKANILERAFQKVFETGEQQNLELRIDTDRGSYYFDWLICPECDNGKIETIMTVSREITRRKQAEEALLQSEARYRRITEGLTDYQYTVRIENSRAVETKHSPACVAVTGYTAEEFAADPYLWLRMAAPEDRELIIKRVEQALQGTDILPIEHRIIRKDGILRWVSDNIILYRDLSGNLLSYDGVVKDVTERRLAEVERDKLIIELQEALAKVRHLSGLLPICASCKKIRNDEGFWEQVETYISEHSEVLFSHAICPECGKKLYPEYYDQIWGKNTNDG